ncbi:MAG: hypothetical protein HYV09_13595 [Deltaproteobacteria bacterium]|nr:hypothetical protein [Deltaproteobacteria bacterium]
MTDWSSIARCRDITDDRILEALESRAETRALLERAAEISKPREAGARVLLVFAKIASPACDWLEGSLRVEVVGEEGGSTIHAYSVLGAGLKERLFPKLRMNVAFEEFVVAIAKFPQAIAPLSSERTAANRLLLTAAETEKVEREPESTPPPPRRPVLSMNDLPTVSAPVMSGASLPTVGERKSTPLPAQAASEPKAPDQAREPPGSPPLPIVTGRKPLAPPIRRSEVPEPPSLDDVPGPGLGAASKPLAKLNLKKRPLNIAHKPKKSEAPAAKKSHPPKKSVAPRNPSKPPPPPAPSEPPPPPKNDDLDGGWE